MQLFVPSISRLCLIRDSGRMAYGVSNSRLPLHYWTECDDTSSAINLAKDKYKHELIFSADPEIRMFLRKRSVSLGQANKRRNSTEQFYRPSRISIQEAQMMQLNQHLLWNGGRKPSIAINLRQEIMSIFRSLHTQYPIRYDYDVL